MAKCICCGAHTNEVRLDSDWLLGWYDSLNHDALTAYCAEALTGTVEQSCTFCGYVRYVMQAPVDPEYYQMLTKAVAKYFPAARAEWLAVKTFLKEARSGASDKLKLIDIGCGGGQFMKLIKDSVHVEGVDFENHLDDDADIPFHTVNLNSDFKLPPADIYTSFQVLEHVEDPRSFLESIAASTRPGSMVFISVPNSQNYRNQDIPDPLNFPPHHLSQFSMAALQNLFTNCGFRIKIDAVERVARPRILARQMAQAKGQSGLSKIPALISSALKSDASYPFESYLVAAEKL